MLRNNEDSKIINAVVKRGHQIASGRATDNPYPKGSIEMQVPYFRALGLDLTRYFFGTLNLSISPYGFLIKEPDHHFMNVKWMEGCPAEDFMLVQCEIECKLIRYKGYVYYPDPSTKIGHFQDESTLEVIVEYIDGVGYGDQLALVLDQTKIEVTHRKAPNTPS